MRRTNGRYRTSIHKVALSRTVQNGWAQNDVRAAHNAMRKCFVIANLTPTWPGYSAAAARKPSCSTGRPRRVAPAARPAPEDQVRLQHQVETFLAGQTAHHCKKRHLSSTLSPIAICNWRLFSALSPTYRGCNARPTVSPSLDSRFLVHAVQYAGKTPFTVTLLQRPSIP